jgi:UDP-N-acetyl-D-glucosamine dehydrogenase
LKISIIGQGYVGLPLAMAFSNAGHEVTGFDLDSGKVEKLNKGISHIEDIPSEKLQINIKSKKFRATKDPKEISDSDVIIIAVPTPLDSKRKPDLSFIKSAAEIIGKNVGRDSLIINESTSYPGTLRNLIQPIVLKHSGFNHEFAISPERVDPGNKAWNMKNTPRLYAGLTASAGVKTKEVYLSICDNLVEVSSPEVAETAKLFENTFRQVNIALVNELDVIAESLGISVYEVLNAASTKPYGFMKFKPGLGVGGHCIPVDPTYLSFIASENNVKADFIELANKVNNDMPKVVAERISKKLGSNLKGKSIVVFGIAYKPNISDIRESPSLDLITILRNLGANVYWNDEIVNVWNKEESVILDNTRFDLAVVAIRHGYMTDSLIRNSSDLIYDCTGSFK